MTHVLVVDDDAPMRSVMRQTFESDGYRVTEAADGDAALRAIDQEQPDLIVTNIFMPERDGLELIREVRRRSATLPILAVSGGMQDHQALPTVVSPEAFSPEGVLKIALVFGASRILAKPFRIEDLRAAAHALVGPARPS